MKPIRLRNYASGSDMADTLHKQAAKNGRCLAHCCLGSVVQPEKALNDNLTLSAAGHITSDVNKSVEQQKLIADTNDNSNNNSNGELLSTNKESVKPTLLCPVKVPGAPSPVTSCECRSEAEVEQQASEFFDQYFASIKRLHSAAHKTRMEEVREQLRQTGTYYLKEPELIFGTKLAWRNASRCIGRNQWQRLQVFDARFATTARDMFDALCQHIAYATNRGSLRSAITVFPRRVESARFDYRVWNGQLIGYAGYKLSKQKLASKKANQMPTEDGLDGKPAFDLYEHVDLTHISIETDDYLIVGDPANVEFTDVCVRLGWRPRGTRFDVLPLVLSANGEPPEVFELPEELVLRVPIAHPYYDWFLRELQLEWFALPAVSNMALDLGGVIYPATPFNGWYMVTEIGSRDLGDTQRYNQLEKVARLLKLDTTNNESLWRDRAITELNQAVLWSFRRAGATLVDHHTASAAFVKHMSNELRTRGGCPADWVWLVAPTASSTLPVYHQEMLDYHLLPNYEYQAPAWRTYFETHSRRERDQALTDGDATSQSSSVITALRRALIGTARRDRKLSFKDIALAIKFTAHLYSRALARRHRVTILFATETGKSERCAHQLARLMSRTFNVHLMCMQEYDITNLQYETLLLIITSTFGNGDAPQNGELFARQLRAIQITGDATPSHESLELVPSASALCSALLAASLSDEQQSGATTIGKPEADSPKIVLDDSETIGSDTIEYRERRKKKQIDNNGASSNFASQLDTSSLVTANIVESNVRFAVFALGSSAYPNYCAFGRYIDTTLNDLGAERVLDCTCGDELAGQERAFKLWSERVVRQACDIFCIGKTGETSDAQRTDQQDQQQVKWEPEHVRFVRAGDALGHVARGGQLISYQTMNTSYQTTQASNNQSVAVGIEKSANEANECVRAQLAAIHNRPRIVVLRLANVRHLHEPFMGQILDDSRRTVCVELDTCAVLDDQQQQQQQLLRFEPGDHLAVYPPNESEVVERLLERIIIDAEYNDDTTIDDQQQPIDVDTPIKVMTRNHQANDDDNWELHDHLSCTLTIRHALQWLLDIHSAPTQETLALLAPLAGDDSERDRLEMLATNEAHYEQWRARRAPNLTEVLNEFRSVKFMASLISVLPLQQPRFYSLSSAPGQSRVHLTIAVVEYATVHDGIARRGLCSNYLASSDGGLNSDNHDSTVPVFAFIRSAPGFWMPNDTTTPIVLIGPGTGIAPFRSFWQQRAREVTQARQRQQQQCIDSDSHYEPQRAEALGFGSIDLFFGCRTEQLELYRDELEQVRTVVDNLHIYFAYSRSTQLSMGSSAISVHKGYVQDHVRRFSDRLLDLMLNRNAHIYVCGDVAMADGVARTFKSMLADSDALSAAGIRESPGDPDHVMVQWRAQNRYHEDIFGTKPLPARAQT